MTEQPQIQPAPLPANWNVGHTQQTPAYVVVQIADPSGVKVVFIPKESAVQIGRQIIAHAQQAGTSLIVPDSAPPNLLGGDK